MTSKMSLNLGCSVDCLLVDAVPATGRAFLSSLVQYGHAPQQATFSCIQPGAFSLTPPSGSCVQLQLQSLQRSKNLQMLSP